MLAVVDVDLILVERLLISMLAFASGLSPKHYAMVALVIRTA